MQQTRVGFDRRGDSNQVLYANRFLAAYDLRLEHGKGVREDLKLTNVFLVPMPSARQMNDLMEIDWSEVAFDVYYLVSNDNGEPAVLSHQQARTLRSEIPEIVFISNIDTEK